MQNTIRFRRYCAVRLAWKFKEKSLPAKDVCLTVYQIANLLHNDEGVFIATYYLGGYT